MNFLRTSTYDARFIAPVARRKAILEDRFFWHEIPQSFDVKSLLDLARNIPYSRYAQSSGLASVDRNSLYEIAAIDDVRKLWFLEKIAKQSAMATAIESKRDILSLSITLDDENSELTKFVFFNFKDGEIYLPDDLLNPSFHLLSVGFSNSPVWTYDAHGSTHLIPPIASHLSVFLGNDLVRDERIRFGWAHPNRTTKLTMQNTGILVILSSS
jgi:hypothetical protein